jgi:succinate dehydrogenase / fumarate reductase, cytochrome b subunit
VGKIIAKHLSQTSCVAMSATKTESVEVTGSFLERNEFLLRRLHSLSGVLPVGAYMCIHLLTNSTIVESSTTFQRLVNQIHDLPMLLVIEWVFIFLPILFHAFYGILIIRGGLPNHSSYRTTSNVRYSFQRMTGMIAFFFIAWHVFHMHGWIHAEWWEKMAHGLGGANFKPYNASSTAAAAMQTSIVIPILYSIGVLACVFHLANGLWTFGITWGLWVTPAAQQRASQFCTVFGVLLAIVGLTATGGFYTLDKDAARKAENALLKARIEAGEVDPQSHKIDHSSTNEKEVAKSPAAENSASDQ